MNGKEWYACVAYDHMFGYITRIELGGHGAYYSSGGEIMNNLGFLAVLFGIALLILVVLPSLTI